MGIIVPMYFICHFTKISVWSRSIVRQKQYGSLPAWHGHNGSRATQRLPRGLIASSDLSHKLKEDGPYGFALRGGIRRSRRDSADQGDPQS